MTDEEGLFWLNDRIEKIKQINEQFNLEVNSYLSFSGGKDSLVLHYLLDMALPNNAIPRVFVNTGIEYNDIRKFVFEMAKEDCRIDIVNSNINIKYMLEKHGYPFKSKEHANKICAYKGGSMSPSILKYKQGFLMVNGYKTIEVISRFRCPKVLLYQFEEDFKLNISDKCCFYLKKNIVSFWQKLNNKSISMTGMRNEEGGQRA